MFFTSMFPKTTYDILENGAPIKMPDIFRNVRAYSSIYDDISLYTTYDMGDGIRPDQLSNKLYGVPEYFWTFFVINPKLSDGMNSWHKNTQDQAAYVEKRYPGYAITGLYVDGADSYTDPSQIVTGFLVGEIIEGDVNGARGVITDVKGNVNQIIYTVESGSFVTGGGDPIAQNIVGLTSGRSIEVGGVSKTASIVLNINAPKYYTDSSTGDKISFDNCALGENTVPYTNNDYENDVNDSRSTIRVIRPSQIFDFEEKYTELLKVN